MCQKQAEIGVDIINDGEFGKTTRGPKRVGSLWRAALHKNSRFLVKAQSFGQPIITYELPAPIHNRLPVILRATAWRLWLGEEKVDPTNRSTSSDISSRTDAGSPRRSAGQERPQTMIPNCGPR